MEADWDAVGIVAVDIGECDAGRLVVEDTGFERLYADPVSLVDGPNNAVLIRWRVEGFLAREAE